MKLRSQILLVAIACSFKLASGATLHDFGSVSVNSTPVIYAFTVTLSGVTSIPHWSISGTSFSLGTSSCTLSNGTANCNGTVSFIPQSPGLNTGALYAEDSTGNLLSTYFVKGVGLASKIAFTSGTIGTLAGNSSWAYADGPLTSASFRNPAGLAMDQAGNIYVADSINQVVRKITTTAVSTFAGNGAAGYSGDNAAATSASLNNPTGVAVDAANNLYIADQGNNLIRRVDAVSGIITTVAGGGATVVTASSNNVAARTASLYGPQSVAVDSAGNLFVADSLHNKIMRVDSVTSVITVFAGGGNGGGSDGLGDGGLATAAILTNPTGLALDSSNNLYIADTGNSMVRAVNASTGVITVVAGNGNYGYTGDSEAATSASLGSPMGIRVDSAGNLYIADFANNVIRQTLAGTGTITTLVGTGASGYSGNGGLANFATLANPSDLLLSPTGNLFIADYGNNVIREISLVSPPLSFPNVVVGTVSPLQSIAVINIGNQPLAFSALTLPASFKQVAGAAACSASSILPAGGGCLANVEFVPVSSGVVSGNLSITSNSLNATTIKSVSLSGTGITGSAPSVALSPSTLNFGTLASGSSQAQSITVRNSGAGALNLGGIQLSGSSVFTLGTTCGTTLAAGATCTITITFNPVTSLNYSATVNLDDSAASSPQQVSISGSGTGGPAGTVSATNLYFSSVLSTGNLAQTITFTNTGTGTLNLVGISLSGSNSTEFSISTSCGSTLAAGQSCATAVYFSTAAVGLRTATLSIFDNGLGSPHAISLSGSGTTTPIQFVPVTPCRVVDTRLTNGPFGGPELAGFVTRDFIIPASACGIPFNAAAYSINVTVVPGGGLGALSIWPAGLAQPAVSTLNSDGRVKANAVIVAAGSGGGVNVWASNPSHVILDVNGYFVAGNSSALDFYTITPCRIADTRLANGPLGGPSLTGLQSRSFPVLSSVCNVPNTAQAYSLNFTVVPHGTLGFLTTWPTGQAQPNVSTLNAQTGVVTANAAIVHSGTGGAVEVFVSNESDLVIDIDGYFAPPASGGLSLYNLNPCRLVDTRTTTGAFVGLKNFNLSGGVCNAPSSAHAYVVNATVVPQVPLGALTLWATGGPQPPVSTLNAADGVVSSNMAIVPDSSGSISAVLSNPSNLIIDISGYFAP